MCNNKPCVFHDQQKRKRRNGKSFKLTSVELVIVMVHGNVVRILQFLKVLACIAYVHQRRFRGQGGIGHDNHDICVAGEGIDECGERIVAHFHGLELGAQLGAAQFELFDDIRDLFEAMWVAILFALAVWDDQKRCLLEEQHLVGLNHIGEMGQRVL